MPYKLLDIDVSNRANHAQFRAAYTTARERLTAGAGAAAKRALAHVNEGGALEFIKRHREVARDLLDSCYSSREMYPLDFAGSLALKSLTSERPFLERDFANDVARQAVAATCAQFKKRPLEPCPLNTHTELAEMIEFRPEVLATAGVLGGFLAITYGQSHCNYQPTRPSR